MLSGGVGAKTNPSASCFIVPVRSEYTLESWDKVNITTVRHLPCKWLKFSCILDEADGLGPTDGSSSYLDCTLQGIVWHAKIVANSSQKAMFGLHDIRPSILEQETASSVSILHLALSKNMTETSGLLVSKDATNSDSFEELKSLAINLTKVGRISLDDFR